MAKTLYSTFHTPQKANETYAELLQRGASGGDVIAINRHSYKDPALDFEETIFELPEPILLVSEPAAEWETAGMPPEENIPKRDDPIGDVPGAVWLLDNMVYPGNLAACLRELGFTREAARNIETNVLDGGALLVMRVPSGPLDDEQTWQVIERKGGTVVTPVSRNPYLG